MSLWRALLSGALSAVKSLVRVVLRLFFRGGDSDSSSPGPPQPSSGPTRELRPLHEDSRDYYTSPITSGRQQPPGSARWYQAPSGVSAYHISPGYDVLSKFLPIYDRHSYEAARAEAKRLHHIEDGYHANHYENLVETQREIIDTLNAAASAWVYRENNLPGKLPADSVDLHGLKVVEAINYAEVAIRTAEKQGKRKIRLIVGKGKHSQGGLSRLRPAIKQELTSRGRHVEVDPRNAGVLVVWCGDAHFDEGDIV